MMENSPHIHLIEMVQTALQQGQEITISANGWSMFPCLLPSDIVKIQPNPLAEINVGDIIVFRRNQQLIVHRFIAPNTAQGDACIRKDEPINKSNYVGKVVAFQRKNRAMKPISRLSFWRFYTNYLGKIARYCNWFLLRVLLKMR